MKKQKILHLLSSNRFANTENTIIQSIILLSESFNIAYSSPNGPISKVLRSSEVNYLPIEKNEFKSISEVISNFSPDIIHAHDYDACIVASKFSMSSKIIAHLHDEYTDFNTFTLKGLAFKKATKHFDKIIWPSEDSKNSYKHIKSIEEKSTILTPTIDCEKVIEKSNNHSEENNIIFDIVMFLDDMKIDEIKKVINILALLQGRGFNFKFGAISSNNLNDEINEYLKETGVSDFWIWINKNENYYHILSKAKILFITKNYEEVPIFALEASALGVPVLSVFCNGLKSFIQNEFNGFLANNDYDLANFAARMLDDRQLWLLLSTNALSTSYIQNDLEKYKKNLIELYTF